VRPVAVRLFHAESVAVDGPLERRLATLRGELAGRLADAFRGAGAGDVAVVSGPRDDTPFGRRLRDLVLRERPAGLIVAGSGSLALARPADLRPFLNTAAAGELVALANNQFSADAVAIACAERLVDLPDLPADNALPRWLAEVAGYRVTDLAGRSRLQIDVDGPLDALIAGVPWPDPDEVARAAVALDAVAAVADDPRAELLVSGRTSARSLAWLERRLPARVRALVEERGLRASAGQARADGLPNRRPPASVLGLLLDELGAAALGAIVARLGDGALIDTRVLLAHRLDADERSWPLPEDRFASDLLLPERIADPWLRELTASAVAAPVPIVLGGHSLVGPALPLALGRRR